MTHISRYPGLVPQQPPVKEQGYATRLLGKDAAKLMGSHDRTTPLFFCLGFTARHPPYQAPNEHLDQQPHTGDTVRRTCAAMITATDAEIGRVLGAVKPCSSGPSPCQVSSQLSRGSRERLQNDRAGVAFSA